MNSRNQTAAAISSREKPTGTATILGIGTANPYHHVVKHSIFPEYYFDLVNNDNMPDLKEKFRRICEKSKIEKRYIALLPEDIKSHPSIGSFAAPSQDVRQELLESRLSLMALEACKNAIKDWGRPVTEITHVIFVNNGGSVLPGPDYELVNLLGLPISTNRFMLYQQGCVGGGTAMRIAKDIVENNRGARVLAVSCEMTSITGFRGPSESHFENLLSQALFGDGSGAIVVGADLLPDERPIFEIVSASQSFIPSSQDAIVLRITDSGFLSTLKPTVAPLIAGGILKLATQALEPLGIKDRESVFWAVHPGGAAILDMVQKKLGLKDEKFEATREVLRDCGNMSSASIFFVMDAMRKRSADRGQSTPGEGLEWGVLFAFGPGLTVETAVLRCPAATV